MREHRDTGSTPLFRGDCNVWRKIGVFCRSDNNEGAVDALGENRKRETVQGTLRLS